MSKRVAIINPVGFDGLGSETLCVEYAKLGLDVWFHSDKVSENTLIKVYNSQEELISIAKNYDRLLFINLWYGVDIPEDVLTDVIRLRAELPYLELCYIYCTRRGHLMDKLLGMCDKYNFMFDKIFTLSGDLRNFNRCPIKLMQINAITLPEYAPKQVADKEKIVFSSGQVAAVKGTVKYFQSITPDFLSRTGEFRYIHEGANFSFHKTDDGVSGSVTLLSLFDTSKHPKEVKPEYSFKHYGEMPSAKKLTIYGKYMRDSAVPRWRNYFAGVSCILGTTSDYIPSNSLFGDELILRDKREQAAIEKSALLWNADMEYADIEKLIAGVPLLISRRYSQILGFNDERLIYNSFSEIPDKVKELETCYDEVREYQWNWFVNSINTLNKQIIEEFTK